MTIEVPVEEAVAEALNACPSAHNEFLFNQLGRPFKSEKGLQNWFDRAVKAAGLPKGLCHHTVYARPAPPRWPSTQLSIR